MNAPVRRPLPRIGRLPVWLLGAAVSLLAVAAPILLPIVHSDRTVTVWALIVLQGALLLITGTGQRYLAWSVFVLACIVTASTVFASVLLCIEWRRTVADFSAEPDHLAGRLEKLDRIRTTYQDSLDPAELEAFEMRLAESIEGAKEDSAAACLQLEAEESSRRTSLLLCLVVTVCLVASLVGYYRLYAFAKARAAARRSGNSPGGTALERP